jgi:hypothetical protein
MKPNGRQEQTANPPGEEEHASDELPSEVPWPKVRPQTVNDATEQTSHDPDPPQRVLPQRTIEERSKDHAHMIT